MRVLIACETSGVIRRAFQEIGHYAVSVDLLPSQDDAPMSENGGHVQSDMFEFIDKNPGWDLLIAHPDCTYLTVAAEWCYKDPSEINKKLDPKKLYGESRKQARLRAVEFVKKIMALPIEKIAIENPWFNKLQTMIDSTEFGFRTKKATQKIQPFEYGHDASKATGLWLKNLPNLKPNISDYIEPRYVCCGEVLDVDLVGLHGCPNCLGDRNPLPRWGNQTDSGQNRLPPTKDRWQLRANTYEGWAKAMAEQWGNI